MDAEPTCGYCAAPLRHGSRSTYFCDPPPNVKDDDTCQSRWARDRLADDRLWMFPYEEFTGFVPTDAFAAAEAAARKRLAV